jgi:hypothetical protein
MVMDWHVYIVKSASKEYDFYQQHRIACVTQQATRATEYASEHYLVTK